MTDTCHCMNITVKVLNVNTGSVWERTPALSSTNQLNDVTPVMNFITITERKKQEKTHLQGLKHTHEHNTRLQAKANNEKQSTCAPSIRSKIHMAIGLRSHKRANSKNKKISYDRRATSLINSKNKETIHHTKKQQVDQSTISHTTSILNPHHDWKKDRTAHRTTTKTKRIKK